MSTNSSFTHRVRGLVITPLVDSLNAFKGNARACILVEPLWGISYNLFLPYASLYMLALGVTEAGIGAMATLSMVLQVFWSFVAGWITDRFGRRRTSLVFDLISWTLPTLLWAFAQDFRWFLAATIFSSCIRVVHISWSCLFIEDSPNHLRVRLYTWLAVAGTVSGFFAPLAGLLVNRFGLVMATRGLYLFAFVAMTSMFFLRNAFTTETQIGKLNMIEARSIGRTKMLSEYREAARFLFGNKEAVLAFLLAVLSNIHLQVRNSFISIILTKGIGLPVSLISAFPPLTALVTLGAYLFIIPRIKHIRGALSLSLGANVAANLILFFAPSSSFSLALAIEATILGTFAAAIGMGVAGPVVDAVLANSVDENRRASILSIVYTLMFAASAPFGWIAGLIAEIGARLPALLCALVMAIAVVLALMLKKEERSKLS
ncbi:hypothetical protein MASR2M78_17870 [Treponema sp.]